MESPPLPEPSLPVSVTAQASTDTIGLGRTPGQRGAEVIAGIRAELLNSPESLALSRASGRVFARLLGTLSNNRELLRFIPARMTALTEVVRRSVPTDKSDLLLVEIAGGFSPRSLHMAQLLPNAQIIEIDLPDVIEEKQRRLKNIEIPPNLSWRTGDLGVTSLSDILHGKKADIVSAEGLNLYFNPEEIIRMNGFVRQALTEKGVFITEVYYRKQFAEARNDARLNHMVSFFLRQAGQIPGLADDDDDVRRWFTEAGFGQIDMTTISDVMRSIDQVAPILDVAVIVTAHNKPDSQANGSSADAAVSPAETG